MVDFGVQQLRLIKRSREFLLAEAQRGVDVAITPECYLNGWAPMPGMMRLRRLARQSNSGLGLLGARVKDLLNVARYSRYEVATASTLPLKFERLVVSWCVARDFSPDGTYKDRYFRTSSRDTPTTLWFLISMDQVVPARFDANIRIFYRPQGTRPDFAYLVRCLATAHRGGKRSADGAAPNVSSVVVLARQLVEAVVATLDAGSFRSIVMPYEAQPFQHAVFRAARRHRPHITTVGYLHSALPPLPTDLIHRAGAPQLLFVHGRGQADILVQHLGWPTDALRTIRSLRYRVTDRGSLGGFVFLPYSFDDAHLIESAFRDFLLAMSPGALPRLAVRNHPVMHESGRHRRLQRNLEALMRTHSERFAATADRPAISVFIGATATILEALEHGVEAIHICSEPLFESHSTRLWTEVEAERLGAHLFRYRLPARGAYIEFGAESDTFESCFGARLQAQDVRTSE